MSEQQIIETLATKVMGWKADTFHLTANGWEIWSLPEGGFVLRDNWNPLHNIADAWQVLTKLKETYRNAGVVYNDVAGVWECHAGYDGHSYFAIDVEGKTECEAICNAGMWVAHELHLTNR
ncbi:BC1872 family protein [Brevibacillus borstelensis]|uniref:BC1872 family protein n=1 Tax=Brevibacillus borstelensis TaxID=45462 RepID=UPI0012DC1482|nr:hypothetical protein [Brevibacillus borstelensis]